MTPARLSVAAAFRHRLLPALAVLALFIGAREAVAALPITEWRLISPPQARSFHTAIYDPVRDRMVV